MRICDLSTGSGRMLRATTRIKEVWADTKEHWNDAARNEFQEKHLDSLPPHLTLLMAAINRFSEVLHKAEKELTDQERDSY